MIRTFAHHGSGYADGPVVCWNGHTRNIFVVALVAKLARIVWAVLRKDGSFDPAIAAAQK